MACAKLQGLGNGRVAFVDAEGDGVHVPNATSANAYSAITLGSTGSQVLDGSGRYVIANGGSSAKQYIGDTGQGDATNVLKTRSVTAASVWGTQLWTVTSTSGQIVSTDLKTNKTAAPLATGAPCVPSELQAVGRWVYWSCGPTGVAGVYDRTAKKSTAVPSGEALVGDGYLVRHDTTNGKLVLTDFHSGTAATRDLADLPKGALDDDRGITWSVDKYGGDVAYADAQQRIHIIAPGVSTQNLAALESRTDPGVDRATPYGPIWGSWQLSKPASGWKLAVRDSLGRTVDTVTGGVTRGDLVAEWDGRTSTGALAPNGSYTWTLTAQPADGTGPALVRTGKATFYKGAAVRHDFGRDGIGDLLTLNSSGGLSIQYGSATGTFDGKRTGTGWPASSLVVPFGDTNGDECNDVLVRSSSGTLTRYNGGCGSALKPSTTHVKLGTGFNQFNVLTSPGDITGDGRADLIARKSSNGAVYLYKGTSAGKLSSPVKVASNWAGYKKIVGVGDLNGDGYGDLVAQDKANVLWRYSGNGKGDFKGRVKIASGWGSSYNAVVGVGDITGDGKADLVARDTSGNLYRYNGDGKGSFEGRKKIATGWKAYKGLF